MSFKGLMTMVIGLALVGCVSKSKYDTLDSQHKKTSAELLKMAQKLKESQHQIHEKRVLISQLENKLGKTSHDKSKLETNIKEMKQALADLRKRRIETEKRISEYTDLLRRFKKMINAGKLSVKIIDGRMVVGLSSDILFSSGSARLSKEGQVSIQEVAVQLATISNKNFQIEGHTDNVPIKSSRYPSNWELASARAITVLKTMVEAGMPAERLSAASFGLTRPVASNEEPEGRAANRRIEIVVLPDLSTLPGADELAKISDDTNTPKSQ